MFPQSLDDFYTFRGELAVDDFTCMKRVIQEGKIPINYPLGIFLEILRFEEDETIRDIHDLTREWNFRLDYDKWKRTRSRFSFAKNPSASFFQDVSKKELDVFINEWLQNQTQALWNPDYAPVDVPQQVAEFCASHKPGAVTGLFNLYEKPGRYVTGYETCDYKPQLIYPFDGWSLARCLEMSFGSRICESTDVIKI